MIVAAAALPETLPPQRRRTAGARQVLDTYRSVLSDTAFLMLTLVTGLGFGTLFSYVSGSSFVLQDQYGLDQQQYGLAFGISAIALIGGAQLNPILLARFTPQRVAGVALAGIVVAGLVLTAFQATRTGGLAGFLVPVLCMLAGGSLVIPNTTALALTRHGEAAGTAAAVLGAIQFSLGAFLAPVVGLLGNDGAATAAVMTSAACVAALAFTTLVLRSRTLPEPRTEHDHRP